MALRPEFLNMIPEFHGESELISRFTDICEKLVNKFYNAGDPTDFQNDYLMSSILAKIKGEAAINISSCVINNWQDLKNALLNSYSDKRDLYSLNSEITNLKQGNESPFDFYNRLQRLLNLQTSYLSNYVADVLERRYLANFFRNNALRVLLHGLKEPIGSHLRVKNPLDLNSALNMLTNDFQLELVTNKVDKIKLSSKPNYQTRPNYQQNFQNKQNYNQPQPGTSFQNNTFTRPPQINNNYNNSQYNARQSFFRPRNFYPGRNNFNQSNFARTNHNKPINNTNRANTAAMSTTTCNIKHNLPNTSQNQGQLYNIDEEPNNFLDSRGDAHPDLN